MSKKQKLELTWIGKDQRPKLEPRILIEDPEKSYHAKERLGKNDIFDNMLIHGDNLLALKALEQEYAGKVKCVFIDPPYNTGSAFEHYEDGLEHSLWLSLIKERLVILRNLLSESGTIWITIDDNEAHYLKVLMDEIFGRRHFLANCLWQKVYSERMDATGFSNSHDHVLVYRKTEKASIKQIPKEQKAGQFGYFDEIAQKYYRRRSLRKEGSESLRSNRPSMWYEIECPDGSTVLPIKPDGTEGRWRWKKGNVQLRKEELDFVKKEDGKWEIYVKQFINEDATRPPSTFWLQTDVGHNHEAKLEAKSFNPNDVFGTPKPERLLKHILFLATEKGDLVIDSFLGSGTTAAVAHKMERRWIGIELGDQCSTHCLPRLKKVIDNEDPGGITKSMSWQGGGGFRYYELGPSLIAEDKWGNPIISKEFDPPKLTQAMCKLEGFDYAPAPDTYWMQGHSSETDFIYVTSQTMSKASLAKLSDEVGDNRSLLVCCPSYRAKDGDFPNLTLKKIPKAVLKKCEWGRDDYSLQIQDLPAAPVVDAEADAAAPKKPRRKFGKANDKKQQELF
jgi:adenine-specific DNA-methyltransferase